MSRRRKPLDPIQECKPRLGRAGANSKLGALIHSWSIPAGATCPGASKACLSVCYAARGRFIMPNVNRRYSANWRFARTAAFVGWMKAALVADCVRVLRIHVAGDFYDEAYIEKWIEIVKATPHVRFFAYTRSWRVPELCSALQRLSALPNIHLWYSADVSTGLPSRPPAKVRVAWMARTDEEARAIPRNATRVKLVFRDRPDTGMKKVHDRIQVCPAETNLRGKTGPAAKVGCTQCRICFTDPGTRVELSQF